jgi:multicomponent Na+:H+ antiporter subunit E
VVRVIRLRALLPRSVAGVVLWWALTEGDRSTWSYAAVLVPLAVAVSLWLAPPAAPSPGLPRRVVAALVLGVWFVGRSVAGGVDVARRVLRRRVDVDPGLVQHRLGLPPGWGRVVVADLTSLMPGTLSIRLEDDLLTVHVLDTGMPVAAQLRELERRVGAVTGHRSEW